MEVKTYGMVLPVAREVLIDFGIVKRTPAEQAEHDAQMAEWAAERAAVQPRIRRALVAIDAIDDDIERAILDLHARRGPHPECGGCDFEGYEAEPPAWPCRTVELIAKRHGIDLSDMHL